MVAAQLASQERKARNQSEGEMKGLTHGSGLGKAGAGQPAGDTGNLVALAKKRR